MSKEKASKCGREDIDVRSERCYEQYFGTLVAPISRGVTWHHCCKDNCETCQWNRYDDPRKRREYLRNESMTMKLEHAINTWKGRIQRELLDLSEKRAKRPLIYRSTNPTFMQKCRDRGRSIDLGDFIRTRPVHHSKVIGRHRSESAGGNPSRWHAVNDTSLSVTVTQTERKAKAPPPKPPEKNDKEESKLNEEKVVEPIVKIMKDSFTRDDRKVLAARQKELRALARKYANEDALFRRGSTPGTSGSATRTTYCCTARG